ncbi:MAG: peptidoglycan DD-metalloendopeptidase family protein [Oscillospiraceae bacterium]|nr:peptidoglycan DD-metalloendopeptidase family protein [Oscillospiraceae bacterium]
MNNRRSVRIIAIVLAFLMLFTVLWAVIDAVRVSARVTQAEIDRLKEEKKEYERKKREIQSRINTIDFERMTEIAKKQVLDDRIMLTGMEIDNIVETIEFYGTLILEKEGEVVAAQIRENEQLRNYKKRVRDMEENGVISYFEIIFDSTSFSDLLARLDFVGDIMQADEKIYNDLIIASEETKAAKITLEQAKRDMEDEKTLQENTQLELEEQLEQANALIEKIEADLESERALRASVEADEEKIQKEINQKVEELRREQEKARAASASSRIKGTGQLMWPVPSSRSVSSGFGMRLHPVYKVYRQHTGIDIPAKHGSNIVAADSGTVITSAYNSSYGNYIVISHGNGITTLYAHMSSRKVKEKDTVSKGQVIGLVGSTGVSTGAHCHFEVSINGSRVNPLNYV